MRKEAGPTVAGLELYAVEYVTGIDGTRVLIQQFTGRWNGDPSQMLHAAVLSGGSSSGSSIEPSEQDPGR
ncbi:hypothetical protein [Streptomyces tuirus]